jgi:hypothetical protein
MDPLKSCPKLMVVPHAAEANDRRRKAKIARGLRFRMKIPRAARAGSHIKSTHGWRQETFPAPELTSQAREEKREREESSTGSLLGNNTIECEV